MTGRKKDLALIIIIIATVFTGIAAIILALRLYQLGEKPVAPTAPESKPKAVSPQCTLIFTVGGPTMTPSPTPTLAKTPTPTVTPTGGPTATKTPTPTLTITPGGPTLTASPTATKTPTPTLTITPGGPTLTLTPTPTITNTPAPKQCFSECSNDSGCENNLRCLVYGDGRRCLNPTCPEELDCACNQCWQLCSQDAECTSNLHCLMVNEQKRCVNSTCPVEENCSCGGVVPTSTVKPTSTPKPTATPRSLAEEPSPTQPVTGLKIPTAAGLLGGLLLISLGLALIF